VLANNVERAVAYVPFTTFLAAIDALARRPDHDRFDTSVWPTYSTATQAQLLGSFRFLGLIDDTGKPTASLKTLVRDKANRKTIMRKILESSYARIIGLDLTRVSPRQFDQAMRQYGMTGETHKKVVSFFLRAARFAELPLSPLLLRRTRADRPHRPSSASESVRNRSPRQSDQPRDETPAGTSRMVALKGGGTITITAEGNIVDMHKDDREFVLRLFDELREYQDKTRAGGDRT
jgi:hypothetical protein